MSNGKIMYKDKHMISLTKRTCSCGSFMKHAVCGHILGYIYRHTKLDQECWFGEQYSNLPTEFARNAKSPKEANWTSQHFNNSILIFVCHNKFFVCVITWNNFFFIRVLNDQFRKIVLDIMISMWRRLLSFYVFCMWRCEKKHVW